LGTPNRQHSVNELLRGYLDAETKPDPTRAPAGLDPRSDKYLTLLRSGQAPLRPGIDYIATCPGVHYFGHVREAISGAGAPAEQTEAAIEYWSRTVAQKQKKGYHLLFSIDPRIILRLAARGIPADALLLSAALQSLDEYAARFYGVGALGGAAGVHFDRWHPHVHLVLHPRTRAGRGINLSALAPAVVDGRRTRVDYQGVLHTAFHRRAVQLQGWAYPAHAPQQDLEYSRQWLLARELSPGASAQQVRDHWAQPGWLAKGQTTLVTRRAAFPTLRLGPANLATFRDVRGTLDSALASTQARRTELCAAGRDLVRTSHLSPARPLLPHYGPGVAAHSESQSLSFFAGRTAAQGVSPEQLLVDNGCHRARIERDPARELASESSQRDHAAKAEHSGFSSFMDLLRKQRDALYDLRESARSAARNAMNVLGIIAKKIPFHFLGSNSAKRILPTPTELADRCASSLEAAAQVVREQFRPLDPATEVGVALCPHRKARRVDGTREATGRAPDVTAAVVATTTPHVGFRPLSAETRARAAALLASIEERFNHDRAEQDRAMDR